MDIKDVRIGIVGNGVLGQAMVRGMVEHVKEVRIYDRVKERSTHTMDEVYDCDYMFLCLPTPSDDKGRCDTTALESVFKWITETKHGRDHFPFMAIRSTVEFGFTTRMANVLTSASFPAKLVHWPEFLTARCATTDFHTPSRHIIGLPLSTMNTRAAGLALTALLSQRFPGVPILAMSAAESEITKLSMNSFFATKVTFFNAIELLCHQLGLKYEHVRAGMLTDGRVAHSHTQVPGPDGKHGFGGTCLPKDLLNLAGTMNDAGVEPGTLLECVHKVNSRLRGDGN